MGHGGSSFFLQMIKPEEQSVVLFISPQILRVLLPFTEEVLAEWSFSQLSSYLLAIGGIVTLTVAKTRLSEPKWSLFRSQGTTKSGTCDFMFSSPLQHKDVYEALEHCWRENKELHDRLFQEVVTSSLSSSASSPIMLRSPTSTGMKSKRMSLGFARSPLGDASADTITPVRASKDDDALLRKQLSGDVKTLDQPRSSETLPSTQQPPRQKSGTFSFFQRKSASKVDQPTAPKKNI